MTLIVGAISNHCALLASDRRLSSNGKIIEEDSTKSFCLYTKDSKMVFGYTGVAKINEFSTEVFIMDAFKTICQTKFTLRDILHQLSNYFSENFNEKKLSINRPYLSVLFVGYMYEEDHQSIPVIFRISNFEYGGKQSKFALVEHDVNDVQIAGYTEFVNSSDLTKLKEIIDLNHVYAAADKAYDIIKKCNRDPRSQNTIGDRANICTFFSQINSPVLSVYYMNSVSKTCYSSNFIVVGKGKMLLQSSGSKMVVRNTANFLVVPKVKRNYPCSCGSGKKYKDCHGRFYYPYRPMFAEIRHKENLASGNIFRIISVGAY